MDLHYIAQLIILLTLACINGERQRVKFKSVRTSSVEKSIENEVKTELRVLVAIKIKNHAHALPTFLASLETLKCTPSASQKCDLWIIFDGCTDQSFDLFTEWLSQVRPLFNTIIMLDTNNDKVTKQKHVILTC